MAATSTTPTQADVQAFRAQLIEDYTLICTSREASLLGRKEVLTGKAKFGIFGDGKELAQLALAKVLRPGDWRSGYYRDQTLMMAKGLLSVKQYFAALYAHADVAADPTSGGRQMGGHFATRMLDESGDWKDQMAGFNSSPDVSPTGSQMPRLLGLAQASKVYRALPDVAAANAKFTNGGNEIAIGTIGDASTSEGMFWEAMNAACVLEVPMLMNVWDDGYGISVPKKYQTVKESISKALAGFQREEGSNGLLIYRVKGWDFPALVATYEEAVKRCREDHVPVLVHVEEVTQPQGHSTSGSHERYKTEERLAWAKEFDCIAKFGQFLVEEGTATDEELQALRKEAKKAVREEQKAAWAAFRKAQDEERLSAANVIQAVDAARGDELATNPDAGLADIAKAVRVTLRESAGQPSEARTSLQRWLDAFDANNHRRYSAHLTSEHGDSALKVTPMPATYDAEPEVLDGRQVLQRNFEALFEADPRVLTFGEDTGGIGGVNQVMEGMQERFGETRVSDTGIRECTIVGQGIGLAMRGLRPIAEIQYLDYLYYALQIMRDDLATVRYRTAGGQKAPLIIRTRGHRLEGIWHSGSPMGAIVHSVRGMHVCVPRNMTQAAGMYNTLLEAEEPALVVECLNGYRKKEPCPNNLGSFKVPLGEVETIREGADLTMVSYGSTLHHCQEACEQLADLGMEVELIDVQTLLPLDLQGGIAESVARTNRLLVVDEDVPGGASAYILDDVLNRQGAWKHLDGPASTLAAKPHLPAYGSDGDYFSKPSVEDIVDAAYELIREASPSAYPSIR